MNKRFKIFTAILITFGLFFLSDVTSFAQYCGGSVTCCSSYDTIRTPEGCSTTCNPSSPGCNRCTGSRRECSSYAGSGACSSSGAGSGGPVCYDNCNGIIESGGCTAYTPPPPPVTPPVVPPPTGGSQETSTSYYCNPSVGCVSTPYSGDSLAACSASCVTPPPCIQGSPDCPDPPTPAGLSSCPEVQESAAYDFTFPGQTRYWSTWDKPPGNDAATRLENESPIDQIAKQYTSPGDMITLDFTWREPEGDFDIFYVEDTIDDTFYFFNGFDNPSVIFTQNQQVLENAVKAGYTQITWVTTADDSIEAAKNIDKRIYFMEGVDNNPWRTNDNLNGYLFHAREVSKVPLVNCASILNASGHKSYYSTNLSDLENDALYCYRRQQLRHENGTSVFWPRSTDDDDDDPKVAHVSGNYLGLEQDLFEVRKDVPCYGPNAIFGSQNDCTKPILPKNYILILPGIRYGYFDNFMYAFMESKGQHEARPDQNNVAFSPAFVRHAIIKIPTEVMDTVGEHRLYALTGPIYTDKCKLTKSSNGHRYTHDGGVDTYDSPAACTGFQVLDSNGVPTDELRAGQSYSIKTKANLESRIYEFYNSDINALLDPDDPAPATPDNWVPVGDISTLQTIRCDIALGSCPDDQNDNRVLKLAMSPGGSGNSFVESVYAETGSEISGKKFIVEFWARSDASTNTVAAPSLQRDPYVKTEAPFDRETATEELHQLVFPLYDGTPSTTMTVTSNWQKFIGTVIFPENVAYDSDTTRIRLLVKAPQNGGAIYYDNFKIIGTEKPTINFNLVPATNQCSQSTQMPLPSTNSLGETILNFTVNNTTGTPAGYSLGERGPGQYYLFAHLQDAAGRHYIGNPNAVDQCGIDENTWDDDIASTCMKEMTILTCNENTPPTPTFIESPNAANTLDAYIVGSSSPAASYAPQGSSRTQMELGASSPTSKKLDLAVSIPAAQATDVTEVHYQIFKMDHNGNRLGTIISEGSIPSDGTQTTFNFTVVPTVAMTNQIYLEVYTVNGNSCVDEDGLVSGLRIGKVIMLEVASGKVFNIGRDDLNNFSCTETTLQAYAKNAGLYQTTNPPARAIGVADPNSSTSPAADNYVNFAGWPYTDVGSGNVLFDLPYNPNNSANWRNQISRLELVLPVPTTQSSPVCIACNQKSDAEPNVCVFSNTNAFNNFGIGNNFSEANFFIIEDANIIFDTSWWQSRGGLIGSRGNIDSDIPILGTDISINCEANPAYCQPYISARAMYETGAHTGDYKSSGIPFSNTSTLDPQGYATQRSAKASAVSANTVAITEDYEYFNKMFDNITNYTGTGSIATQLSAANYTSDGDTNLKVIQTNDLTISDSVASKITAGSNERKIIFVNGDLTITGATGAQITSVTEGGFLMFVVRDDIIIESSVGHSGNTNYTNVDPVLEGIFLADDDIIIETKGETATSGPADNKFVAAGSFIALDKVSDSDDGIVLERQYEDKADALTLEKNSHAPVEMFIFRPDLVVNAPQAIRRPSYEWLETN